MPNYNIFRRLSLLLTWMLVLLPQVQAGVITIPSVPLYIGASVSPLVMLDITKDQNLYKKAYDDYSDLDGDGVAETTYDHTIDYYGYFDSYKCYSYESSKFSPVAASLTLSGGNPVKPSTCLISGTRYWHGNFLNWVSMSRMDTVRKLLYGGFRSTDSSSTVLERAFIPVDAHSWAKYYNPYLARLMDTWPAHQDILPDGTTNPVQLSSRYPDISTLTPFSSIVQDPTLAPISSSTSNTIGGTQASPVALIFNVGSANTGKFSYGDQVLIESGSNYMIGVVSCVDGIGINMFNSLVANSNTCGTSSDNNIKVVVEKSVGSGTLTSWNIYNYSQTGLSICNTTPTVSFSVKSQDSTQPPLMRVAKGNFSLWAANERLQCYWRDDTATIPTINGYTEGTASFSGAGSLRNNGNRAALSGIWASALSPNMTTSTAGRIANGVNGSSSSDYIVRVDACTSSATIGNEKCAQYPDGNYKPIGLLQYYGESGQLMFGMFTGSYNKNKSGGTLRKNISNISDEINTTTDGSFKTTNPATGSIINTLSRMRIYNHNLDGLGSYTGDGGSGKCTFGETNIIEGECKSWGNPMSEVYVESLRYLAGNSVNTSFNVATDVSIAGLPPTPATAVALTSPAWTDPITSSNYCAPLNVLVFNSAASTYENDGQINCSGITGCDAVGTTNTVGSLEGINGNSWFVGNGGTGGTANMCSSKSVSNFSDIYGICPEGAGTEGTYKIAGPAYFAHTNRIRSTPTVPSTDKTSLKVSTFGIALASNTPKHGLTINDTRVTIMPQARFGSGGSGTTGGQGYGAGAIVDWKIVCEIPVGATALTIANITKASAGRCNQAGTGAFYWNHEDIEQGGDYDQDMWGRVQYQISGNNLDVTTDIVAQSAYPAPFGFGYAIKGTDHDGPHFHSGLNAFTFSDSNAATVSWVGTNTHIVGNSCSSCDLADVATTARYAVSGTTGNNVLQDPLWYAAKYGGFKDKNNNNEPDQVSEWDVRNADGSTTGCTSGCDGVPDNFFLVTNPNFLESALDKVFREIMSVTSASSVATNSTSLQTGSRIYQAVFNSGNWSGQLLALGLNPLTGDVISPAIWRSGDVLNTQKTASSDTRTIITYGLDTSPQQGIPFTWIAINGQAAGTTMVAALNTNGLNNTADTKGELRVDYLRGAHTNEGQSAATFRERASPEDFILGDIVNSSPVYVGVPEAGWGGASYSTYRTSKQNRTPMLYVGGNDGMLHGFRASDGLELLAYVPGVFYNYDPNKSNLSQLTNQSYTHKFFVDGTPMVNDIELTETGKPWKTVLVGGMNWGGRAYYALDVSDPNAASTTPPYTPTSYSGGFTQGNAASILMWEFTSANDSDLGYTVNQPTYPPFKGISEQIVKMRNGKWAVVVGNGYNSTNGVAALFIFFLDRAKSGGAYSTTWTLGTDYIKIVADRQSPSNFNGLSTPKPFSARGDGIADWIYAGDLNGNVWKFDVTDSNPANWNVAYGSCTTTATPTTTCTPLFIAKDSSTVRQPITTAPQVARHPNGGVMVLFGTGKYQEASDTTSPFQTQTMYGVWDNGTNKATNMARTNLLQQSVVTTADVTVGTGSDSYTNSFRLTTDYCIGATGSKSGKDAANNNATVAVCNDNWTVSGAQKGWRMDLPTSGERIGYNALLRNDRIVAPTLIPSTTPCEAGGSSWLMELDALTGRRLTSTPFDVNGDATFSPGDLITFGSSCSNCAASGIKPADGGLITTPTVIKSGQDPTKEYKYSSSSKGTVIKTTESSAGQSGRIAWREITP